MSVLSSTWQIYHLKCQTAGKLLSSALHFNGHFLSNRFQIPMSWRGFITICIENEDTKSPPSIKRLDFCKSMLGILNPTEAEGESKASVSVHRAPATLPLLVHHLHYLCSPLLFGGNSKKPINSAICN